MRRRPAGAPRPPQRPLVLLVLDSFEHLTAASTLLADAGPQRHRCSSSSSRAASPCDSRASTSSSSRLSRSRHAARATRRRSLPRRRSSCSWSGHAPFGPSWRWTRRAPPPSPRSAGASTACRSRSSWRPPARGSSPLSALLARLGRRLDLLSRRPARRARPAPHAQSDDRMELSAAFTGRAAAVRAARSVRRRLRAGGGRGGLRRDSADVLATLEGLAGTVSCGERKARHSRRDAGDTARVRRRAARIKRRGGAVRGATQRWYLDLGGACGGADRSAAGRLAAPARGRARESGRRAGLARTGRRRTTAPPLHLRALALLAHQRLRRGGEAVAHLRALSAAARHRRSSVPTRYDMRRTSPGSNSMQPRQSGSQPRRSRSHDDAGRAHAGGRPGDGRQRELLDRPPRARSHGLRRAAGRRDLGSLRARSRQSR